MELSGLDVASSIGDVFFSESSQSALKMLRDQMRFSGGVAFQLASPWGFSPYPPPSIMNLIFCPVRTLNMPVDLELVMLTLLGDVFSTYIPVFFLSIYLLLRVVVQVSCFLPVFFFAFVAG